MGIDQVAEDRRRGEDDEGEQGKRRVTEKVVQLAVLDQKAVMIRRPMKARQRGKGRLQDGVGDKGGPPGYRQRQRIESEDSDRHQLANEQVATESESMREARSTL